MLENLQACLFTKSKNQCNAGNKEKWPTIANLSQIIKANNSRLLNATPLLQYPWLSLGKRLEITMHIVN